MIAFQNVLFGNTSNNIFFIFKKLFLTSAHQNDLKILKNINLKQIIFFFKSAFEIKENGLHLLR